MMRAQQVNPHPDRGPSALGTSLLLFSNYSDGDLPHLNHRTHNVDDLYSPVDRAAAPRARARARHADADAKATSLGAAAAAFVDDPGPV
jgi:hypothetical protein